MNLSDKRVSFEAKTTCWNDTDKEVKIFYEENVKESIKELKNKLCAYVICKDNDKCDKCKIIEEVFGKRLCYKENGK